MNFQNDSFIRSFRIAIFHGYSFSFSLFFSGALPFLVGRCGLKCPIYATDPVHQMGQMFMYDLHQSRFNYEEFDLFSLDDVDAAFERITKLKYSESVPLEGDGRGLTVTAMPAGHMIGGTIWRIVKDNEEDIVYAVDYNHKRERHLNGCFLEQINRPSLLITDAYNGLYAQARRKERDERLMTNILGTLRAGGNVLIAVDTAGRVLELAHMLDQLWRTPDAGLMAYSLALLNTISYNVIDFAKSQIAWMTEKIMKTFESQRQNPFDFKHLHLCNNLKELQQRVREPRVVLASQPDLESGFARELFVEWCANPRNSIVLTQRCSQDTLAFQLVNKPQPLITIGIKQRIPLEGLELEEYRKKQKQKQSKEKIVSIKDADSDSDSEGEEGPEWSANTKNLGVSETGTVEDTPSSTNVDKNSFMHDLMIAKHQARMKGGGFSKESKKSYPMYPAPEVKIKWDDYGEIINPEEYRVYDYTVNFDSHPGGPDDKEKKDEPTAMEIEAPDVPTKCIINAQTLYVNSKIQMIDFEGRSDKDSLKKIISLIKPRRVILVRGSPAATEELASFCMSSLPGSKIFTPQIGEIVDATTESHIYQVTVEDARICSLEYRKAKDGTELAWVDSMIIKKDSIEAITNGDKEEEDNNQTSQDLTSLNQDRAIDSLPTLTIVPPDASSTHVDIIANELKLSDFKQVLVNNNVQAEFHAGVLHCNNRIAIKRNESGKISVECFLSEDFFLIEELLYSQYAII